MADEQQPVPVNAAVPDATAGDWGDAPAQEEVPANMNDGWGLPPSAGILPPGNAPPTPTAVSAEAPAFVPASQSPKPPHQQPSSPEARGARGGRGRGGRGRGERGAPRGSGRGGRGRGGGAAPAVGGEQGVVAPTEVDEAQEGAAEGAAAPVASPEAPKRKEVYVRPVGPAREKMSASDLEAKMEAMRLANAKLMERRAAADEDAAAYEAVERQAREKDEARRRHQAQIDEERRLAAERKLGKVVGREWDREKTDSDWDHSKPLSESMTAPEYYPSSFQRGGGRGRGRGGFDRGYNGGERAGFRGRGGRGGERGRGRGQAPVGNGAAAPAQAVPSAANDPTPAEAAAATS